MFIHPHLCDSHGTASGHRPQNRLVAVFAVTDAFVHVCGALVVNMLAHSGTRRCVLDCVKRFPLVAAGLTQYDDDDLLSSMTRKRVYEFVLDYPGHSQSEIAEALGRPRSTVRDHLQKLVSAGYLAEMRVGRSKRFVEPGCPNAKAMALLRDSRYRELVDVVLAGECSVSELATQIETSPSTASKRVRALESCGVLKIEYCGRTARVTLTDFGRDIYERL